ncbi:hypothetical protein COV82_03705 [Candidatus Peregrinibacteria bacterium CG11_big_fil_rev_8_21_14_0_20_46_8]|nr:MAG: hypothetical protein COV82_03705 [Candidatus Peregrinibacteria bacterium CG11_big_fil_rev_8_21_14_0_20_46_8]
MQRIPKYIIRNLILLLFIATVVVVTQSTTRPADAKPQESVNKYLKFEDDVSGMVLEYHSTMNDLFNERIAALNAEKDGDTLIALVQAPPRNDKGVRECIGKEGKPNLSTYCLAEAGMVQFFQFRQGLEAARAQLEFKAADKFERIQQDIRREERVQEERGSDAPVGFGPDLFYAQSVLNDIGIALQRIETEIDIAEKTLDQSLLAYNEFQMALPLHRKYREIIKSLENYRDEVASIRDEITLYPFKFTNVSTTRCQ